MNVEAFGINFSGHSMIWLTLFVSYRLLFKTDDPFFLILITAQTPGAHNADNDKNITLRGKFT